MARNTAGLIEELERIKELASVEDRFNVFVCATAREPYKYTVKRMVRRHIKDSGSTMNIFLADNGVERAYDAKVANAYRVLMLNNMIEWVKKGDYE